MIEYEYIRNWDTDEDKFNDPLYSFVLEHIKDHYSSEETEEFGKSLRLEGVKWHFTFDEKTGQVAVDLIPCITRKMIYLNFLITKDGKVEDTNTNETNANL